MNFGLIGILLAIVFFIATIVLAIRLARRKKPVWACNTTKIIGLGANAPPELELTFDKRHVSDVYRTLLIFFNRGNETIREDDITENVTVHFKGAEIFRQAIIRAKSKEAIKFYTKQGVKDGDNVVELSFLYLDHNDGAVVEVLHTRCEEITCSGNIIGVKAIASIGEFEQQRPKFIKLLDWTHLIAPAIILFSFGLAALLSPHIAGKPVGAAERMIMFVFAGMLGGSILGTCMIYLGKYLSHRKFPRWSILKE